MMSTETAKKRKMDGLADAEGSGGGSAVLEKILAEMKAQMMRLQNELDDTKGRLSRLDDELESRSASMQNEIDEMKSRVSHMDELEHRCEALERSVQILIKETKWEYSAPAIPASHWIDRGFDEDYAVVGMGGILRDIKDRSCELRSGSCRQNIVLGSGYVDRQDEVTVLLHDDALLPHWQEFANAMQLYQNPEASHQIYVCNLQLTSSVMDLLTPALKDKPFKTFFLDNNAFINNRKGIEFAIDIIQGNLKLTDFAWTNSTIDTMDDANHLAEAIIRHPLIVQIRLENCFGEDVNAYDILCSLLTRSKQFSAIDLDTNNIRTDGGTELSNYLATNPPLSELYLENNHLDDNDLNLIARALKRNTNLRELDLGRNDITKVGRDALRKAVFDSISLNAMSGSNHTCRILGLDFGDINDVDVDEPHVRRGRKIYSLLSSRNRKGINVRHLDSEFEDDSLKLVPKVLESVQWPLLFNQWPLLFQSDWFVHPLSVMYEILRSWKMPTLYENNGAPMIE